MTENDVDKIESKNVLLYWYIEDKAKFERFEV